MWVQSALLILFMVGLYTALFVAANQLVAATRTLMWLIHLLFGLCVAHEAGANRPEAMRFLWPAVVTGLCAYVLTLVFYVALIPDPASFDWLGLGLAVGNVRQLGFYSAVGVSAALGLAILQTHWSGRAASAGAATVLLAVSFWSGTRGSILAVWVAFGLGLIWFRALRSVRAIGTLMLTTAAAALLSLLHSVPNGHYGIGRIAMRSDHPGVEDMSSGRLDMWIGTFDAILEQPLFGYGESQFRIVVPEAFGGFNHPHNALLQILFQWGLTGGACFVALAAWVVWKVCRATGGSPNHVPAFLVAASLLTMALFEGTLYHAYPIMMIAVGVGVIVGSRGDLRRPQNSASPRQSESYG